MATAVSSARNQAGQKIKARIMKDAYPEPLVIPPSSQHTHTFILLHGRGSNGERFGIEFLKPTVSSGKRLQQLFPGMKFILPTAKKRRSTILQRLPINQ